VDSIEGLSPAIAIEQKTTTRSPALNRWHHHPKSTTTCASSTARSARPTAQTAAARFRANPPTRSCVPSCTARLAKPGDRIMILAPVRCAGRKRRVQAGTGEIRARRPSFALGSMVICSPLDDPPRLDKRKNHNIDVVVDRLLVKPGHRGAVGTIDSHGAEAGEGTRDRRGLSAAPSKSIPKRWPAAIAAISVPATRAALVQFSIRHTALARRAMALGSKYDFDPAKVIAGLVASTFRRRTRPRLGFGVF